MKCLTAWDARSDRLLNVSAEMHPSSSKCAGNRESIYVVLSDAPHEPAYQGPLDGKSFLGLVDGRQAMRFPQRIFADLLRPWQAGYVRPDTPLEEVQTQLMEGMLYSLPIMSEEGSFLGAVSRDSVLHALVGREKQMFQILKQGIDMQEQQRSLIAFEIHDGFVQCITAAHMHLEMAAEGLEQSVAPRTAVQFARGMALLQEGIEEARSLIHGLRPPMLDGSGLMPAIESLIEQHQSSLSGEIGARRREGPHASFQFPGDEHLPHRARSLDECRAA